MSGNAFGLLFRVVTWGESHGKGIGVVVDGCPPGFAVKAQDIQAELNRRRPGRKGESPRKEPDRVEIFSGIYRGMTTGTPISMVVYNHDVDSRPYEELDGAFTINRMYERFTDRISKRQLTALGQRWERRGWLTSPADAVSPRYVTDELSTLLPCPRTDEGGDTVTGVTGGDRQNGTVTGVMTGS